MRDTGPRGFSAPTDVIKRFISDGQVGLGLFGNEDARTLLESNKQLSHRLQEPCDIQPLKLADVAEQRLFAKFVAKYDVALVGLNLFKASDVLTDQRALDCLMAISERLPRPRRRPPAGRRPPRLPARRGRDRAVRPLPRQHHLGRGPEAGGARPVPVRHPRCGDTAWEVNASRRAPQAGMGSAIRPRG